MLFRLCLHMVRAPDISTRTGHGKGTVYTGPLGSEIVLVVMTDLSSIDSHNIRGDIIHVKNYPFYKSCHMILKVEKQQKEFSGTVS